MLALPDLVDVLVVVWAEAVEGVMRATVLELLVLRSFEWHLHRNGGATVTPPQQR